MEIRPLGVSQFFLARGLKPTALTALVTSNGAGFRKHDVSGHSLP